ncbi:MAG: SurA N-terminal domain-containing protein [Pseudonocardiales bacterium]|nr:SurA N-terminal domain-containing protein [Pseudonocardiales bacterium]
MIRSTAALVVSGVLVAALTGCGGGPSQPGAAVIVGSTAVSLSDTQQRIDVALAKPGLIDQLRLQGNEPADISREVVTRAVQHVLLAEAARREGIGIRDDQVDAELTREGGVDELVDATIYDRVTVREAVRDQLISQALARKLLTRVAVTVDVTSAISQQDAVAKARQMAAGPAQAAAVLAADPRAKRGQQLRASLNPQLAASILFGTPAGSVVAVQTSPAPDGWTVLRVTARSTTAPPVGGPGAVSQLDDATLDDIGRRFTQPLAGELGVRVNPRYGTWDPLRLIVLGPGMSAGLVLPAVLS